MNPLYGHDAAVAAFRESLASGRLHHAWLITGPEGVGKALFASKAALRLLAEAAGPAVELPGLDVPDDHRIAKLFEAGSHPDFKLIKREVWEKDKLVPEHERSGTETLGKNIRIIQIRWLVEMLSSKPALSGSRAIVVDAADDLEASAANALLKNLEEPRPGNIFFLISHSPERLLPTIRSRCRQLRLGLLDDEAMTSALRAALPGAEEAEIAEMRAAGQGSPGRAIGFRGLDIEALDRSLRDLVTHGDATNARRSELAQSLALKSAQARYEAFLQRAPSLAAEIARHRRGPALAEAIQVWEKIQDLAGGAVRLSLDANSVVFEIAGLLASLAPAEQGRAA